MHKCRKLAFDLFEGHLLGLTLGLLLPRRKQLRVRVLEIVFHRDIEPAGGGINPFRLPLDFPKVAKKDYDIDCVEYVNVFFMTASSRGGK